MRATMSSLKSGSIVKFIPAACNSSAENVSTISSALYSQSLFGNGPAVAVGSTSGSPGPGGGGATVAVGSTSGSPAVGGAKSLSPTGSKSVPGAFASTSQFTSSPPAP